MVTVEEKRSSMSAAFAVAKASLKEPATAKAIPLTHVGYVVETTFHAPGVPVPLHATMTRQRCTMTHRLAYFQELVTNVRVMLMTAPVRS